MKKLFTILAIIFLGTVSFGPVQAATFTDFTSGNMTLSQPALTPVHTYVPFMHYRKFDLGHASFNEGTGVTNGGIVELFNVAPNTFIEEFGIRITRASIYSGVSAEVGDGTDIDGFVGNTFAANGVPFVDLSTVVSEITKWNLSPFPIFQGIDDGGSTTFVLSGVSISVIHQSASGVSPLQGITLNSNHGPFFSSGASPYITKDTIDMTIYTGSNAHSTRSGTTPVFEAYIRGYRRVILE